MIKYSLEKRVKEQDQKLRLSSEVKDTSQDQVTVICYRH